MSNNFTLITRELEFMLAEQRTLLARGPQIRIWHRGRQPGAKCWPGEEVAAAALVVGAEFPILLSTTGLLILDYLASHRLPQSATEIADGLNTEPFYAEHGSNVCHRPARSRVDHRVIRTYINRLRRSLAAAFAKAHLDLDPYSVLASETTDSNVVKYRLRATVEFVHGE